MSTVHEIQNAIRTLPASDRRKLREWIDAHEGDEMLTKSAADITAGRTQPAKQAIDEIAAELNLPLQRTPTRR